MKKSERIFEFLQKNRLVALLTPGSAEECLQAYELLNPQNVVLEIALRSDFGLPGIAKVLADHPDALVLAGTVMTREQAEEAISAGAAGVVSPDYFPEIVDVCAKKDIMCVPGGLGDAGKQLVNKAAAYGCTLKELKNGYPYQWIYKLFPAYSGGRSHMDLARAWRGPFKDLNVIYTGGITEETLERAVREDPQGIFCASALTKNMGDPRAALEEVQRWREILKPRTSPAATKKAVDVEGGEEIRTVSFGEALIRLSPPPGVRLAQAKNLDLHIGGAEANVAVGLAQQGMRSCYVTALPENELGENALRTLRSCGVDTRFVIRKGKRIGTYYLELGAGPRPSKVIYDRSYSALTELAPEDVDWDSILDGARWFHWTGITPALGDSVLQILLRALEKTRDSGVTVSCDLNYRKKLWSEARAREVMTELMPFVDVLFGNEEDPQRIFGIRSKKSDVAEARLDVEDYRDMTRHLAETYSFQKVAISLRESVSASENFWSACLFDGRNFYLSRRYRLTVVDRVGAGDAFASGLIAALCQGKKDAEALEFAVAGACLKHSIYGDFNLASPEEVEKLAGGDISGRVQR